MTILELSGTPVSTLLVITKTSKFGTREWTQGLVFHVKLLPLGAKTPNLQLRFFVMALPVGVKTMLNVGAQLQTFPYLIARSPLYPHALLAKWLA